MKKLIVFLLLSSTFSLAYAQNCIHNFVDKYQGMEQVSHFTIGGNLLSMMGEDEDGRDRRTQFKRLEVLTIEERSLAKSSDIQALRQGIQANDYEELIRVRDGKELIHVYLQEEQKDIITQLIVLVESPEQFTLVSLSGQIHFDDLQDIELDGSAGEVLRNIPTKERP